MDTKDLTVGTLITFRNHYFEEDHDLAYATARIWWLGKTSSDELIQVGTYPENYEPDPEAQTRSTIFWVPVEDITEIIKT